MLDEPIAPEKPQQPQRREFNCRRTGKTVSYCGPASVIIDRAQAAKMYTARRLFALNKRQRDAKASSRSKSSSMTVGEAARSFSAAAKAYDDASDAVHAYWEQRAREHDRRQPGILESILTVLEGDPTRSFEQVSADIGGWCSGDTIRRFFDSLSYSKVLERVLPLYAQHKSHITKVLMMAVVGIAFEDSLENGGTGVRPSAANGGTQLREKGDVYFVDVEVTGSTSGTSTNPKFQLLGFLRDVLFPQLQKIVGPGGPFEGYCPIIQWDNAGPHTDKTLVAFAETFCAAQKPVPWGWEPQGPQMPHANVLDLLVFPKLSRNHGHVMRAAAGRSVAKPADIWKHARAEYLRCDSVDIAKAFVLAYRLMAKVIAANGGNHFLHEGGVHSGVRDDFKATVDGYGITRKDGLRVEAPAPVAL